LSRAKLRAKDRAAKGSREPTLICIFYLNTSLSRSEERACDNEQSREHTKMRMRKEAGQSANGTGA
jgi:hypothetical protein